MHMITATACEHSDRGVDCERHPADWRPAPEHAAVVTPSSTQSNHTRFPPRPDQSVGFPQTIPSVQSCAADHL
jgi:hypothetical protein